MEKIIIGSTISFGDYNWRILDIQNNVALIITEDIIGQRAYHDIYTDVTWADCDLRKYLNGEFYENFSSINKPRIISVTNKNPNNPWHGTKGGVDTQDNIFLLTIEDVVCRYFGNSSIRLQNRGKNQNYWYQRKDENNSKRMATLWNYKW